MCFKNVPESSCATLKALWRRGPIYLMRVREHQPVLLIKYLCVYPGSCAHQGSCRANFYPLFFRGSGHYFLPTSGNYQALMHLAQTHQINV